jgi:hypothetical protein
MKVSIVSIFKDESDYLKEWIEFHLLVGVDKFYLVNNNSIDGYQEVLKHYISSGIVEIFDLDVDITNNDPSFKNEQIIVHHWIKKLNEIVKNLKEDWVIHVSTDEFLYPTEKDNIKEVLKEYDETVGEVSVNWTLFGNSGIHLKNGDLLIENLTKSSLDDHEHNFHVKPIFKPKSVSNIPSVHFTYLKPEYIKVDATGNQHNFRTNYEVNKRVHSPLHINHYRLRDLSWTEKKIMMYKLWDRSDFLSLDKSYNDIENYKIFRFIEPLKIKMNFKNEKG